jgi:hypothetical protein
MGGFFGMVHRSLEAALYNSLTTDDGRQTAHALATHRPSSVVCRQIVKVI